MSEPSAVTPDFDDLAPFQMAIKIGGKLYILTEASGDAAVKYRNAAVKAARMVDGKVIGMDGVADVEPLLVSRCLYLADANGHLPVTRDGDADSRHLVPVSSVLKWPVRVQKYLFDKIKEVSPGLEEKDTVAVLDKQIAALTRKREELDKDEDPAKNSLGAGTDGSA